MAKGKDTKENIISLSLKQFMQKGFTETSFQSISKKTGITKGGLFYHFPGGKEELYLACLENYFSQHKLPDWMAESNIPFKTQLLNGFEDIAESKKRIMNDIDIQHDNAILMFQSFLYEATRKYPQYQLEIDRCDNEKRDLLRKIFIKAQANKEMRQDIDAESLAIELDALLQQLLYLHFVNHSIRDDFNIIRTMGINYYNRLIIN